jgi:hypothetical protein
MNLLEKVKLITINTIQPISNYNRLVPAALKHPTGQKTPVTTPVNPTNFRVITPQLSPRDNPSSATETTYSAVVSKKMPSWLPLVLSCVGAIAGIVNVAFNIAKMIDG